jgi:hypothetical protein
MIKLKSFVTLLCLVIVSTSCHHGNLHIVVRNGSYHMDIKRSGSVQFTADTTAIQSISPGGYISYERNEKRMRAEYDEKDGIYMEIYDDGKQVTMDQGGKEFLAEAVKEMVARNAGSISH